MTERDGVIKYHLAYTPGELPSGPDLENLFRWFRRCREQDLIGQDPLRYDGVTYGNISQRVAPGFVISGTQTGGKRSLDRRDLAWVTTFDPVQNRLTASGPARPSSEAMTHGQIYRARPEVNAVIHVHSPLIWRRAQQLDLPTTAETAAYGTPAMAAEVERLLNTAPRSATGLFVMGGHEDGVVAYGADMDAAGTRLFTMLTRASASARDAPGP